jgi:CubicO group peptidase (beta-lactamase class C family)
MAQAGKWLLRLIVGLMAAAAVALVVFRDEIDSLRRVWAYAAQFDPAHIDENFRSFHRRYPVKTVRRSGPIYELRSRAARLPETFTYAGTTRRIAEWIDRTQTTGIVVLKDGELAYEAYFRGNDVATTPILMSVSKSVVSFLVGVAVDEGKIESLERPVDSYVPALKGSGYEGVRLKDVLQMSSGIRFNEDYADLNSDIAHLAMAFVNGSVNDFVRHLQRRRPPGTFHHYVSADTQVVAMVLEAATGEQLADLTQSRLWARLGAEYDAYWLTDRAGDEFALGGLNATVRDMARFGQLYARDGRNFAGEQLVSADWVRASVTPDAPHLMPGRDNPLHDWPMGYGYQWWIPENQPTQGRGDFSAIGIYGQFVYVNPTENVVVAKTSAYEDYNTDGDEMEFESMEAFRAIARGL